MTSSDLFLSHLAPRMQALRPPALRQVHELIARPGVLSFALGMPAVSLFPAEEFADAARQALLEDPSILQYGIRFAPLRGHVVDLMARAGVEVRPEQIFLTTGAQQGLRLLATLLLDDGAPVILERTVYEGIQNAVLPYRPEVLAVPTDADEGIDVEAVETLLRSGKRPAFLYIVTDGHNPLGCSLDLAKRERLVELARQYDVLILEDHVYGLLRFDETDDGEMRVVPPLYAMAPERVIYLSSFSKILAPGLRIGWMVVSDELAPKLSLLKHGVDLDVSNFVQQATARYLDGGGMDDHLKLLRREYRARRDAMLSSMEEHFPDSMTWNRPEAGLYIWGELPGHLDAADLLRRAVDEENVAFCPGFAFDIDRQHTSRNTLRLCFANASLEQIEDGTARLGRVARDFCR